MRKSEKKRHLGHIGYNMFVGYRICHHRQKGQKGTKERSGASTSSSSRSSLFELSLGQDLPTGFTKEEKSRFSLGQDLPMRTFYQPRTTNYQLSETNSCDRTTKLPAVVTIFSLIFIEVILETVFP